MTPITEIENWTKSPNGALQIFKPEYRTLNVQSIAKEIDFDEQYKPFGYKAMFLSRDVATVFISR